uniref:NADH dehydrogenase subunit 6 n=1 Tax=Fentonia ocypete TaxID=1502171 RepID=UPI00286D56C7|nr:NADH dehydrogenase subunit 6 [Fentonia ocypete]WKR35980.1 NADH dehydrogenase subunit 6 [Fentonia ocypete]
MLKMFISMMIMLFSINMFFLNNPLSMGLMILMQTMLMCLLTGMMIKTYWFSYILFLTFLGGLLVLFIYVSSIASNELFNISFKMKMMISFIILFILLILIFKKNNLLWMNFSYNSDMNNMFNMYDMFQNMNNKISLNKLYNSKTFLMMMMMVIYLFITLIAIVKITNIFYGPIRSTSM